MALPDIASSIAECGMCPKCGYNLVADAPIEIDGWMVSANGVARGARLTRLVGGQAIIAQTLARASGRMVQRGVLADRAGIDAGKSLDVTISMVRKKVPGIPIEAVRGAGYLWRREPAGFEAEAEWLRAQLAAVESRLAAERERVIRFAGGSE